MLALRETTSGRCSNAPFPSPLLTSRWLTSSSLSLLLPSPAPPKVADIIFRSLNLQLSAGSSGADEFLPVLVYVVLQTKLPHICSHLAYIEAFRHPGALAGRAGYLLVSLKSAIAYIEGADVDTYRAAP